MRSESLDFPLQSQASASAFRQALAASLLLHAVLIAVIVSARLDVSPLLPEVSEKPFLNIILNKRVPQDAASSASADTSAGDLKAEAADNAASPALDAAEAASDSIEAAETPGLSPTQTAALTEEAASAVVSPPEQEAENTDQTTRFSTRAVNTAIQSYLQDYRQELSTGSLEACLRYQQEHGSKHCPQYEAEEYQHKEERAAVAKVFAAATRGARHAAIRQNLSDDTRRLKELMDGKGPLAGLAAERYALNREYIAYLSGNLNSSAMAYVQMTQRDNPNMPFLLDNMLQFICKEMPCIYEFNGFRVVRKQTTEVAEEDKTEFRVVAPLFRGRK